MDNTERFFWDTESCTVITGQKLRAEYDELKATDDDFFGTYDTFEQYVNACCDKNGTLQRLYRGSGQFNSAKGDDIAAVYQFSALLEAMLSSDKAGRDVKIVIDGYILEAYDNAALMQGLLNAVNDFSDSIC